MLSHGTRALCLLLTVTLVALDAAAGSIEDFIVAVSPSAGSATWLPLLGSAVVGICAILAAILPQGSNGLARRILDFLAANVGNARNAPR